MKISPSSILNKICSHFSKDKKQEKKPTQVTSLTEVETNGADILAAQNKTKVKKYDSSNQELFDILKEIEPQKIGEIVGAQPKIQYYKNDLAQNGAYAIFRKKQDEIDFIAQNLPDELRNVFSEKGAGNQTVFHWHINPQDLKKIRHIIPDIINDSLIIQDIYGSTPIHRMMRHNFGEIKTEYMGPRGEAKIPVQRAVRPYYQIPFEEKLATTELYAQIAPENFKKAVLIQNEFGNTPLHIAIDATHIALENRMIELLISKAPKETREALVIQNKDGDTPLHLLFKDNNISLRQIGDFTSEKAYILLQHYPKQFEQALFVENNNGEKPIDSKEFQKFALAYGATFATKTPDTFKKYISKPLDKKGNKYLHLLAQKDHKENTILKLLREHNTEELRKELLIKNKAGYTPMDYLLNYSKEDTGIITTLIEKAPDELKEAILPKDENKHSALKQIFTSDEWISEVKLKILANFAPSEFKGAVLREGKLDNKFLNSLSKSTNFKLIAQYAPEELSQCLTIKDKEGKNPLHRFVDKRDTQSIIICAKAAPEGFKTAASEPCHKDYYSDMTLLEYIVKHMLIGVDKKMFTEE